MKVNKIQKITILIYLVFLIYVCLFKIPFVDNDVIVFDSIFSNYLKVDLPRFIIIIILLTVVSVSFIFILKDEYLLKVRKIEKNIIIIFISISVIIGIYFYLSTKNKSININSKATTDTAAATVDTAAATNNDLPILPQRSNCNEQTALKAFHKKMDFTYPDWKIYGEPVVEEISNCTYNIRFRTIDPHLASLEEKEVIIVQIEISGDSYYFKSVRGTLY